MRGFARRRFIALLTMAALLLGVVAPTAWAVPTDSKIMVGAKAQFVTATTLNVSVTYVCPAGSTGAFVSVAVSQQGTVGSGFVFVPCTDERETVVVTVTAGTGTFTLGQALANGFVGGGFFGDQHQRNIQIVL
jgi:hypothetical protein